jgi:hypothetical protein
MKKLHGCALLAGALFCAVALAGTVKEYSADMVDVKSGKVTQKISVATDKFYAKSFDASGKDSGLGIVRLDKNVMYAVIEETRSYMEIPISKEQFDAGGFNINAMEVKKEKVGAETVSGYSAVKYRITAKIMGQTSTHYEWFAPEFDPMPIRTEMQGVTQEMRNIAPGPQNAALFDPPKGYKRDKAMEDMMKGMMGKKK